MQNWEATQASTACHCPDWHSDMGLELQKHERTMRNLHPLVRCVAGCCAGVNEKKILACLLRLTQRAISLMSSVQFFTSQTLSSASSLFRNQAYIFCAEVNMPFFTQEEMGLLKNFHRVLSSDPSGQAHFWGSRLFQKPGCLSETCKITEY